MARGIDKEEAAKIVVSNLRETFMTIYDIAEYLGVAESTVRAYRTRQQMPEPDEMIHRTPLWYRWNIEKWAAGRKSS